jgi:CTD small phosphatase-like protein 2
MLSPKKGIAPSKSSVTTRSASARLQQTKKGNPVTLAATSPPRRVFRERESKLNVPPSRSIPRTPPPKTTQQMSQQSPYASPTSPIASARQTQRRTLGSKSVSRKLLQDDTTEKPVAKSEETLKAEPEKVPIEAKTETLFSPAYKIDAGDENYHHTHTPHSTQPSSQLRPALKERESEISVGSPSRFPAFPAPTTPQDAEMEDDYEDEFDPFLFIKNLPELPSELKSRKPLLPKRSRGTPPVCLALDLDETLVHCSIQPLEKAELTFSVAFNGTEYKVYVRMRPYLAKFLRQVSQWFEIVVFTASQRVYADKLLNILDPTRRYIKHRVFRDSCVCVEGNYLKDLTVLGRDLSQVAIVDNSVQAFGFQLNNGIPIESWFDDDDDRELLNLIPFLQKLKDSKDVRPLIQKTFRLQEFVNSLPS